MGFHFTKSFKIGKFFNPAAQLLESLIIGKKHQRFQSRVFTYKMIEQYTFTAFMLRVFSSIFTAPMRAVPKVLVLRTYLE